MYASSTEEVCANSSSGVILSELERKAIYSLASNCDLPSQGLESMLSFRVSDKYCSLVPLCDCDEHRCCFLRIFSYANPAYMRYYADGNLRNPSNVNNSFLNSIKDMNQKLP